MKVIHVCLIFAATNTGAGKKIGGLLEYIYVFFIYLLGSTMFTGISSLLKFLKKSFQIEILSNNHDEQQFQTAVIDGIGEK